jgi:hypothetical protein
VVRVVKSCDCEDPCSPVCCGQEMTCR